MKIYNEGTRWETIEYEFSDLVGKTLKDIRNTKDDERIIFETVDDEVYMLWHSQDCCEQVCIESVTGDLFDLIGTPILVAEERSSNEDPPDIVEASAHDDYAAESQTWTFYTLRTIKGSVDIRWYGSSNGYYSERVEFTKNG